MRHSIIALSLLLLPGILASPLQNERAAEVQRSEQLTAEQLARRDFFESLIEKRNKAKHLRPKRDNGYATPQPISGVTGAPILGGTNAQIDAQNPDALAPPPTDNGNVPNLKWAFSDSHTRLLKGGWVREQLVTDLPPSVDIAAAQQHLVKGAFRELHWHRVAEWGIVLNGSVLLSAVDEHGQNTAVVAKQYDIWYFPKGSATLFSGNFEAVGTTFNVDDWLAHTPVSVLAKNFGVNESVFANLPAKNPYILRTNLTTPEPNPVSPNGALTGNSSYLYQLSKKGLTEVPGGGGTLNIIDSHNFPISNTIAATFVVVKPKGLRELHWHPNADEWLYFHSGHGRATVFLGNSLARTFDFSAGDTAVFPDNSGHYIENTSETEDLVWIEIYKSDRAVDISLSQWLALTPPQIVANTLNVSLSFVEELNKVKQIIVKG